jgi:1-pyrroline-5-carboxylate dehydrogenase
MYTKINSIRTITNHIGKFKYVDKLHVGVRTEIQNIKDNIPEIPLVIGGKRIVKNLKPQYFPYDKEKSITNHIGKFKYVDKIPLGVRTEIQNIKDNIPEIPLVIGGKRIVKNLKPQYCPYDKERIIANYSNTDPKDIQLAIEESKKGKKIWAEFSLNKKLDIFNKASSLVENEYANKLLASTILGQGKTIYEAEIDAISELSDFLRFNSKYMEELNSEKLVQNDEGVASKLHWSGIHGFVAAVSPFNFTAIGGNLATAPLFMGNTVLWKPSDYSILSNYYVYELLLEAGLPSEVLQFMPGNPKDFINGILQSEDFGGLAFTGSSPVFKDILKDVYKNIDNYKSFPRIVGETGGNNYHFVFPDMKEDLNNIVNLTMNGAFGYSGQKCSATKRIYIPSSFYDEFLRIFKMNLKQYKIGNPENDYIFSSSVIHENSFNSSAGYIMKNNNKIDHTTQFDGRKGYTIYPTIFREDNLYAESWKKELFGPILSVHPYDEKNLEETAKVCTEITGSNLTGSVFYREYRYKDIVNKYFANSVGNFYINDKCTGATVGQQPFGGFGSSGTNDKAGSKYFLTRFGNCIVTKEGKI